jgi:glycosyltransferase involved in cell wall biosynthesis
MVWFEKTGPIINEFKRRGIRTYVSSDLISGQGKSMRLMIPPSDIFHIHLLGYGEALYKISLRLKRPSLLTLHSRSILPRMNTPIVCVSNTAAAVQERSNTIHVIHNGVKVEDYPQCAGPKEKKIIIRVCRPSRCAQYFLDALKPVLEHFPECELWLVGEDGDSSKQVKYFGVRSDVPALLAKASIFAYAPTPEMGSHDLSVLEAMAAGVTPVVTDVPCVNESVEHMRNGLLVPYGDSQAFSEALIGLLRDEVTRKRLSEAARHTVLERFSSEKMGCAYETLYRTLAVTDRNLPLLSGSFSPQ